MNDGEATPAPSTPPSSTADPPGSIARRLQRVFVLSWRWRRQLILAGILLPRTSRRLKTGGYGEAREWLDQQPPTRRDPLADGGDRVGPARELAFVVRLAARFVPDATCLRKALVLQHLLTAVGIPAVIRFGVRRPDGDEPNLDFHAWTEVEGEVVSELPRLVAPYSVLMDQPPDSNRPR